MTDNQTFELILNTESKVIACNIADFEVKANHFLSTLTQQFETDEDFGKAKEEVKLLKTLEEKTRLAIKNAEQGEISTLIAQAEQIAERFREERLARDKLVKQKEQEIKDEMVHAAFERIIDKRNKLCAENDISLALEMTTPKLTIKQRLDAATKNKRTIASLKQSVNSQEVLIDSEISTEIARLTSRLKLIPLAHIYLFNDAVKLIASTDELEPIINERVGAEKQREEKIKAEAEQHANAQAQHQVETPQAPTPTTETVQTNTSESAVKNNNGFVICITLPEMPQDEAVTIARGVKAQYGDKYEVTLKPIKG